MPPMVRLSSSAASIFFFFFFFDKIDMSKKAVYIFSWRRQKTTHDAFLAKTVLVRFVFIYLFFYFLIKWQWGCIWRMQYLHQPLHTFIYICISPPGPPPIKTKKIRHKNDRCGNNALREVALQYILLCACACACACVKVWSKAGSSGLKVTAQPN